MRYYRVQVIWEDGNSLIHDLYAENALCAVLMVGQRNTEAGKPVSVSIQEF